VGVIRAAWKRGNVGEAGQLARRFRGGDINRLHGLATGGEYDRSCECKPVRTPRIGKIEAAPQSRLDGIVNPRAFAPRFGPNAALSTAGFPAWRRGSF